jgi:hypothetical protein
MDPPFFRTSAKNAGAVAWVYLQTRLSEHVLPHRDRVTVQMEVSQVLDQQAEQLVGLFAGPARPRPRFTDRAFHRVAPGRAPGRAPAGNRSSEAPGPGMVDRSPTASPARPAVIYSGLLFSDLTSSWTCC